jgi:hypothetical protein
MINGVNLKIWWFYQLFTVEERRIPFIFDDFHLCRSRVIELDMIGNRIFTLCRMITWVVFLRMLWNFISAILIPSAPPQNVVHPAHCSVCSRRVFRTTSFARTCSAHPRHTKEIHPLSVVCCVIFFISLFQYKRNAWMF